jgi:dipeptidyl aminopeptidase/acylaminoacyl peptidase
MFIFCLSACDESDVKGPTVGTEFFNYETVTQEDIEVTVSAIEARNTSPENVTLAEQSYITTRYHNAQEIRVFEYQIEGQLKYATVIFPPDYEGQILPVAVLLDGLNQSDRQLQVEHTLDLYQYSSELLADFIVIIPIFRGTYHQSYDRYESEGNFCDAYDGAADDAVAAINLVSQEIPEANMDAILAVGGSRGGNVAYLLGQRDSRIAMSIAMAGPTDFYRQSAADQYNEQYQCQFFDSYTAQQAKEKMLASSPLHFIANSPITRIHHSKNDNVVPTWNAQEMYDSLTQHNKDAILYWYDNGGHSDFYGLNNSYLHNFHDNVSEFLAVWSNKDRH